MPIDEIEVIKQKLVDQIKPIGVYLFGSFANGTAHADSDFDFYIIVDDNEKDLHAVATSAYKAIRGVKQWLDYAAQDLGVARHLFENYHPKPLEIVCYHCQQSAEKAIKAVIVSLHWPTGIPKSHDLSFLLNQIHNYISIPDAIGDAADALTPFGTMTRYPNELTVEERHAKQAIAYAEQILNWTASALR